MKLGIHLANLTFPGGTATLADDLARVARQADDLGFARISVMDHVWQIGPVGPVDDPMLEAYTTLGFLAAHTRRAQLLAWVTAVVYREPGLLAKCVTTLDVLSGGRAMLGIGAAWNDEEAAGLGLPFPPTKERFERLEEALQIHQLMWTDSQAPYQGRHYTLTRTLNRPQPISRPHPPILIGGGGERKTLRLVAQYADACNLFDAPDLAHKLEVLRGHCADLGRDEAQVEKTVMTRLDPGPAGENVDDVLTDLRRLADLGVQHVHLGLPDIASSDRLLILGERVLPVVADW